MDLTHATDRDLVVIDCDLRTKEEVIGLLTDKLLQAGKITSREIFLSDVLAREELSATGISDGIAVPHGKSAAVREASFAFARMTSPVRDWESLDEDNEVTLVFLLAIPEAANDAHIDLLAELMGRAQNSAYLDALRSAATAEALYARLVRAEDLPREEKAYDRTVVAVTACPAGIAHTHMAAQALIRAGEALGIRVCVEKQGAAGIEDRLTDRRIREADVAIFATDVAVREPGRFADLPVYRTTVTAPVADGGAVLRAALNMASGKSARNAASGNPVSLWADLRKAVLTGISHIIPLIVAGGMVNALMVLLTQVFGLQALSETENSWLWFFRQMGNGMLGTLLVPVLSAYVAASLGEKPALAPGFAAGIAANLVGGGFLCGLIGGIVAGYTVRFLRRAIPIGGTLSGFLSFWLYPILGTLVVGISVFLVFGEPLAYLNDALTGFLHAMNGVSGALLGALLGVMVSFDLGGPVNKAAYAFCLAALSEGVSTPYAAFASAKMVSGFAVTAATRLFPGDFTPQERKIGSATWILALAGITEGAIPFMMGDPLRVICSLCAGSAVTGAIVGACNMGLEVPGAGIFSLFLLKDGVGSLANPLIWYFAAVLGTGVSVLLLAALRKGRPVRR